MKNNYSDGNYLDKIPCLVETYRWNADESGNVTIFIENTGLFNKMAQKFFGKPKISQIHLDEMGSFIWPLIDGERTVYDISEKIKEHFGEKAEPLYDRLVTYMEIIKGQGFIIFS